MQAVLSTRQEYDIDSATNDLHFPNRQFALIDDLGRAREDLRYDILLNAQRERLAKNDPKVKDQEEENSQHDAPSKSKITYINIDRTDAENISEELSRQPLKWIHVQNPNEKVLDHLEKTLQAPLGALREHLKDRNYPSYNRHKDNLVCTLSELEINQDKEGSLIFNNQICAVLGDNYLITISLNPSKAVNRVLGDLKSGMYTTDKTSTSNYMLSRILGSTIHINEEVIREIQDRLEQFYDKHSQSEANSELHKKLVRIEKALSVARNSTSITPDLIRALNEKDNLFGAKEPRDVTSRYQGRMERIHELVSEGYETISHLRDSWRISQDRWQNTMLYKLALLGGITQVPALAASFLSIQSLQIPATMAIAGLGVAGFCSAILVGLLYRQRREMHQ